MASPRLLVLLDGGKVGIPYKGNEVRKKNSVLWRHHVDVHNLGYLALEVELVKTSGEQKFPFGLCSNQS